MLERFLQVASCSFFVAFLAYNQNVFNSISIIMQKSLSIVAVTSQKPLRGRVLSDDRDYVSIGDLRDISKLYSVASESEGKQFFVDTSKYIGFLLASRHFKKTVARLVNKKLANWQRLLVLKNVWDSIEDASSNKLPVQRDIYVAMEKIARGELDDDTERFIRRHKAHLSIVHKVLMDLSGGTALLEMMEGFSRMMHEQTKLFMSLIKPVLADIFRFQKDVLIQNVAASVKISVAFFASYQTEVTTITKFAQQLSLSLGGIKPFIDSLEQVSSVSGFAFSYQKSLVSSPRDNVQLAIYDKVHEINENQRHVVLLYETQFRINNPGATDEQIEELYSGGISSASLAEHLRPALQSTNNSQSYTKVAVDELIDALRLQRKEKTLLECLGTKKGRFIKKRDIEKHVDTNHLSRMISTVNKKLRKGFWRIEHDGNPFDGYRYHLVKLNIEQRVTH